MTWFKVDDKLHSHRKIAELGTDVAALSLWVVAGSWSADQLTDGWIPENIVPRLLPVSKARALRFAAALELVGLWDRDVRDSKPGWQFHGWSEPGRQPSAAQVIADREANAVRQAEFRERKRAERNAVSNAVSNGRRNEAPTRPDPTSLPTEETQHGPGRGDRPTAAPAGAVPLIDALTAEGFVVTWDLGLVEWDRVRLAVEKSGIPAMVEYARRRNAAAKQPAYSVRAWLPGWATLPTLNSGARLRPAAPSAIGAPSEASAVQARPFSEIRHEFVRPAGGMPSDLDLDFGEAFGMPQ